MIARIWHGATAASHADADLGFLTRKGTRDYRSTPGNRGVRILQYGLVLDEQTLIFSDVRDLQALAQRLQVRGARTERAGYMAARR